MHLFDNILALTLFAAVSSFTPGPNNLMLMSSGTRFGFARTVPHLLGVTLGFVFMIVCVGAGLVRVFTLWPVLHTVLKIASMAYLLWLAWKIAVSPAPEPGRDADADGAGGGTPMTFMQAALFQWVNPKAWTMALGAVSAYIPPTQPVIGLALVAGVFGVVNLPSCMAWAAMGVQLRRFLADPRKLLAFNLVMAALLVASLVPVVLE